MSEPYTPDTDTVRGSYMHKAVIGPPAMAADFDEAQVQFDRWLAAHDAQAAQQQGEVERLTRAVTTLGRIIDELVDGSLKVKAERDQALVDAAVQRARADKANRRLATFTGKINTELATEIQRQKANALREAATWLHDQPWTADQVKQRYADDPASWTNGANDGVEWAADRLAARADQLDQGTNQ